MHQAREGEEQEDRHAQHQVHLVGPVQRHQAGGVGTEGHDALRPVGQRQHHARILVAERIRQGDQAQHQLHPQDDQDAQVGAVAGEADAVIEDAAVQQQRQADEADEARDAARGHGHQLLLFGGDEGLVHEVRREQAHRVATEQEQDADMEQVAAPAQLALAQQLRRIAFPGVLVAVEARQAAHQEHRQADVRVDVEEEVVQRVHACAPWEGWGDFLTIWIGCGWPGLAWPSVEQPPNTSGSTQLSSSDGSGASGTVCARSPASSSTAASTLA